MLSCESYTFDARDAITVLEYSPNECQCGMHMWDMIWRVILVYHRRDPIGRFRLEAESVEEKTLAVADGEPRAAQETRRKEVEKKEP